MKSIDLHNYEAFLLDYSDGTLSAEDLAALKAFVITHPELLINLNNLQFTALSADIEAVGFKDGLKRKENDSNNEELLNYLENNLSTAQKAVFEKRLAEDTNLANTLAAYQKTILITEPFAFENKAALIKTGDDFILNSRFIAYIEGQMLLSEKITFEHELKESTALEKELALFLATRLIAEASIVYPDKAALKKESKIIALFNFRTVAAMAAAILLLIGLVILFNYFNAKPFVNRQYAGHQKNSSVKNTAALKAKENNTIPVMVPAMAVKADPAKIFASHSNHSTKQADHNIKQDTFLNTPETKDPVRAENVVQQKEAGHKPEAIKPEIVPHDNNANKNNAVVLSDSVSLADHAGLSRPVNHSNYSIVEATDDEPDQNKNSEKPNNGFWKRAVRVAKQANRLGVKVVDGEEKPGHAYSLSFNAFSVEKK